jgi:sugar lactone lactonase YvrE
VYAEILPNYKLWSKELQIMKLTKPLVIVLAATFAFGGCMMSGKKISDQNKHPDNLTFPPPPDEPRFYWERAIHSSADVRQDTDEDKLRRALTGERIRGEGLGKPYGIAVQHGRVYVGDSLRRFVAVFDFPQHKYFKIGAEDNEQGQGKLQLPLGIDVDKKGELYVFDGKLKQIEVYDRDGNYVRSIGDPNQFARPAGIAVTPDGSRVYAVDIGGTSSNEHKVLVFDGQSGKHLFDIGKRGIGDGEFNLPRDAVIAPDGSLYVVDGGNFRVEKFDADGKFISKFGDIGRQPGQFSRPKEAAVDPEGNIYVVDATFGNFQIFNPKEQLLLAIGSRSMTDAPAKYGLPSSVAVDEDGRVYVVDQYFRKVDVFRPAALSEEDGYLGTKALQRNASGKGTPTEPDKSEPAEKTEPSKTEPNEAGPSKLELNDE